MWSVVSMMYGSKVVSVLNKIKNLTETAPASDPFGMIN